MSVEQECIDQWRRAMAKAAGPTSALEYECLKQWCQGAVDYWVDQAETGRDMIDYIELRRAIYRMDDIIKEYER